MHDFVYGSIMLYIWYYFDKNNDQNLYKVYETPSS